MLGDIYHAEPSRQARRHPRRRGQLPRAEAEAVVRAGPQPRPNRRPHAGDARARRRHEGVPDLTVDQIEHPIDELKPPVKALGYNGQWPGPTLRVNQGDKVRANFKNNLKETTGVHFHGVEFDDFCHGRRPVRDPEADRAGRGVHLRVHGQHAGLAHVPLAPQRDGPGRPRAARRVHRRPADPTPYDASTTASTVWISNDTLGGFTINGHGFPAVVPILAARARRSDPVHERGRDDASVAQPRLLDRTRGAGRVSRSAAPHTTPTRSGVSPGNAGTR